jgi:dihydroorotate dehydrogenase (NAD+) catalytic subunit
VTDIVEIALAAEEGGADSLALINTVYGMAIDWQTGRTMLSRGFGGYSGPAVKPIALYNVFKVAQKSKLPLLAMGGISNWQDALEFFNAGASMIAIGTSNFTNHFATQEVLTDLETYFLKRNICLTDIIGKTVDLFR